MKLTPESLRGHLAERLLPVYLISGDEPLLAGEAADAVRTAARSAGFSEREVYFIERAGDWDEVRAAAAARSLFGARRVLEIRLASARPGTAGNATLVALTEAHDPDIDPVWHDAQNEHGVGRVGRVRMTASCLEPL